MLVIIQVGHNEASDRYIRNKLKAITQAGMTAKVINLPDTCETEDVVNAIFDASVKRDCKAIMVQLPPFLTISTRTGYWKVFQRNWILTG